MGRQWIRFPSVVPPPPTILLSSGWRIRASATLHRLEECPPSWLRSVVMLRFLDARDGRDTATPGCAIRRQSNHHRGSEEKKKKKKKRRSFSNSSFILFYLFSRGFYLYNFFATLSRETFSLVSPSPQISIITSYEIRYKDEDDREKVKRL